MKTIKESFNIVWYVVCWNEMAILPHIINYWKQIARKVVVCDNGSTDGTLEYLSTFDWIEIRHFNSGDKFNDLIHLQIKNEIWKEQKNKNVDFVIVSDVDEVIWSNNLLDELHFYKKNKISIVKPTGYDFISPIFPLYDGKLLHEKIKNCCRRPLCDKCVLIDPNLVENISYSPGCHYLNGVESGGELSINNKLLLFHFKNLSCEYLLMRHHNLAQRLSDINLKYGWGVHYLKNKNEIIDEFNSNLNEASKLNIDDILANN